MKIYTYYHDVGFKLQNELINIWKASWKRNGFEPFVLCLDDAKKSNLYQRYYDFVQRVHQNSVNIILEDNMYWMAAQLEIVAFHTIEEPSYYSDYDMINNGFKNTENVDSKLYWRDADCPCFASGDKSGWEKYITFLFEQEEIITKHCIDVHKETGRIHFGDQDFLVPVAKEGHHRHIFNMKRDSNVAGLGYSIERENKCKVLHLSHENMSKIKSQSEFYDKYSIDELRIILAYNVVRSQT